MEHQCIVLSLFSHWQFFLPVNKNLMRRMFLNARPVKAAMNLIATGTNDKSIFSKYQSVLLDPCIWLLNLVFVVELAGFCNSSCLFKLFDMSFFSGKNGMAPDLFSEYVSRFHAFIKRVSRSEEKIEIRMWDGSGYSDCLCRITGSLSTTVTKRVTLTRTLTSELASMEKGTYFSINTTPKTQRCRIVYSILFGNPSVRSSATRMSWHSSELIK